MENLIEKIKELTDGYTGQDVPGKRLEWLKNIVTAYKRYLPARVVEKIKIDPTAKRIEGERRNITVLFADLSGFTALSETMDAEDIANIINDFFTRMVKIVFKYEGSVDKFLGDALMVLFGAPVAHHDDPERAVRAALDMQTEMIKFNEEKKFTSPLSMSIGINTGPAVALNVGSDERMEYTVIGDTVNLAARLEGVSQAGETIISNFTFEKIADVAEVEKRPAVKVKGKKKPVVNYLVKSMREHYRLPEITKLSFVGRAEELKAFKTSFTDAKKKLTKVVGISGSPGSGKTRLGVEAEAIARTEDFTVLNTRCMPYESNYPYVTLVGLLGNYFKIKPDSNEEEKRLVISLKMKNLNLVLDDNLPFIGILYGIQFPQIQILPPDEVKKKIFIAAKEILQAEAKKKPLFVRVEDLQWSDPTSIELLDFLLNEFTNEPVVFVFEYRSDFAFPWLALKNCSNILLGNFSKEETKNFNRVVLDEKNIQEGINDLIFAKSQGNPLFITEIIKLLMKKSGIRRTKDGIVTTERFKKIEIAESVSSIIFDQIDRVSEIDRRILQYASVIGRDFQPAMLSSLVKIPESDLVANLERLEHFEGLLVSVPETGTYEFLSPTTHDVVYGSLLKTRRRELHTRIGEELEKLPEEKIFEHLEQLAFHFARSMDERKGVQYLKSAAEKSYHLYALKETMNFFEQALDIIGEKDLKKEEIQDKLEIMRRQGLVLRLLGEFQTAIANQKRSLRFARLLDAPRDEAGACLNIGIIYAQMGTPKKGLNYWTRARRIAKKIGEKQIQTLAVNNLGNYYFFTGDFARAVEYFNEALALSEEAKDKRGTALASLNLANLMEKKGDFPKALEYSERAHKLFSETGEKDNIARSLVQTGLVEMYMGNMQAALEKLGAAIKITQEIGDRMTECTALGHVGLAYAQMWQLGTAYENFYKSMTVAQMIGETPQILAMSSNIGDVHLYQGNLGQAVEYHKKALELALQTKDLQNEATVRRSLGWDYYYSAEFKKSMDEFGKSQEIFQQIGDRRGSVVSMVCSANVMNNLGFFEQTEAMLGGIEPKAREMNDMEILAMVLDGKLDIFLFKKDFDRVKETAEELLDLSKKIGNKRLYAWTTGKYARSMLLANTVPQSKEQLNASTRLADEIGDKILKIHNSILGSELAIADADLTAAMNTIMKATEQAAQVGARSYHADTLYLTSNIFKKIGNRKQADEYMKKHNEVVQKISMDLSDEEKAAYNNRIGKLFGA